MYSDMISPGGPFLWFNVYIKLVACWYHGCGIQQVNDKGLQKWRFLGSVGYVVAC